MMLAMLVGMCKGGGKVCWPVRSKGIEFILNSQDLQHAITRGSLPVGGEEAVLQVLPFQRTMRRQVWFLQRNPLPFLRWIRDPPSSLSLDRWQEREGDASDVGWSIQMPWSFRLSDRPSAGMPAIFLSAACLAPPYCSRQA